MRTTSDDAIERQRTHLDREHRDTYRAALCLEGVAQLVPLAHGGGAIDANILNLGLHTSLLNGIEHALVVGEHQELVFTLGELTHVLGNRRPLQLGGGVVVLIHEALLLRVGGHESIEVRVALQRAQSTPCFLHASFQRLELLILRDAHEDLAACLVRQLREHVLLEAADHQTLQHDIELLLVDRSGEAEAAVRAVAVSEGVVACEHLGHQALDQRVELHGATECRCATEQDGTASVFNHRQCSLRALCLVRLEVVCLVRYHNPEAAPAEPFLKLRRVVVRNDADLAVEGRILARCHHTHVLPSQDRREPLQHH